ncbi:ABC transporter permease [Terrabacter tumescens]|uniref:ABC transporter permease n=1 Tax=Terrabacter tumescens TaxID=60443 RepID=A0ABQ2IEQ9_9MICO|nr:ABC transporter permease [Terrabacter tumescens]GGN08952.1 ABC transporter permease [Terrabacter tumescens]
MEWLKRNQITVGAGLVILVAAYVFYAVNSNVATSMFSGAWFFAVPLVLGALTGVVGERSGVVNIGIEGQMLVAAFAAFFSAAATGSLIVGVLVGMLAGIAMGAFLALTTVKGLMDQIIAGVVINIVATGLTSFFYRPGKVLSANMPQWEVPLLSKIPLIGDVFFQSGPIALFALVSVPVVHFALFRTRWGLRTRSIGEYPSAADTAGIDVIRMRLVNVTIGGIFAGAAGAYLSMEATGGFERGMTAGRGFLALAILIFGGWRPLRVFAAALFFGFTNALASQLQGVISIPQQFITLLPYLLTLIVLAVAAGRVRAPAAVGQPFVKGEGS